MKRYLILVVTLAALVYGSVASALTVETLIAATTDAATKEYTIMQSKVGSILQVDSDIDADKSITIEQKDLDGNWNTIVQNGTNVVLSADTTQVSINTINVIRVNKPSTTASVGVVLIHD